GGTFRLGVIKCALSSGVYGLQDNVLASSTAEGGAGAADSSGVIYTGTAVTSKAVRVLGYLEYTLTTAGTWDTAPSVIHVAGPRTRMPGDRVQVTRVRDATYASGTTTIPNDNTIPQNTEGVQWPSTLSITPTSAINLLEITASIQVENSSNNNMVLALFQDSTADALSAMSFNNNQAGARASVFMAHQMRAATTSSTTFKVRAGGSAGGTTSFNASGGAATLGGVLGSYIQVEEIMA
ncbi:MAG TPA: hypothetical protein DCZ11_11800, partial [Gammaproteobacteria bacterium]|nr:hypothetical protein [Gammaproteobacteria bacterium]MCH79113.1 hypothetical protein [Gammaproteobacteria bacterium]